MNEFESKLTARVTELVEQLTAIAREATHAMLMTAFERPEVQVSATQIISTGLARTVEAYERECIQRVVNHFDGNLSRSAKALGMSRALLQRKMAQNFSRASLPPPTRQVSERKYQLPPAELATVGRLPEMEPFVTERETAPIAERELFLAARWFLLGLLRLVVLRRLHRFVPCTSALVVPTTRSHQ